MRSTRYCSRCLSDSGVNSLVMGITSLFRMIMALQRHRERGSRSTQTEAHVFLTQQLIWVGWSWVRDDERVRENKVNPRGYQQLDDFPRVQSSTLQWEAGVNSIIPWAAERVSSLFLTCYLQHWLHRVSPSNGWQLRHNTHQRWHMMFFLFQWGHPEIKPKKTETERVHFNTPRPE